MLSRNLRESSKNSKREMLRIFLNRVEIHFLRSMSKLKRKKLMRIPRWTVISLSKLKRIKKSCNIEDNHSQISTLLATLIKG